MQLTPPSIGGRQLGIGVGPFFCRIKINTKTNGYRKLGPETWLFIETSGFLGSEKQNEKKKQAQLFVGPQVWSVDIQEGEGGYIPLNHPSAFENT